MFCIVVFELCLRSDAIEYSNKRNQQNLGEWKVHILQCYFDVFNLISNNFLYKFKCNKKGWQNFFKKRLLMSSFLLIFFIRKATSKSLTLIQPSSNYPDCSRRCERFSVWLKKFSLFFWFLLCGLTEI